MQRKCCTNYLERVVLWILSLSLISDLVSWVWYWIQILNQCSPSLYKQLYKQLMTQNLDTSQVCHIQNTCSTTVVQTVIQILWFVRRRQCLWLLLVKPFVILSFSQSNITAIRATEERDTRDAGLSYYIKQIMTNFNSKDINWSW